MKNLKTILLTVSGCLVFAVFMCSYGFMMYKTVQVSNNQQKIVQAVINNSKTIKNHAVIINKYHDVAKDFKKVTPKKETKKAKK